MKILEFQNVTFSYAESPVLEKVSFSVDSGDFLGLIGPNGAGKSTILKLALNLEKPDSGKIILFGKERFNDWQKIGYVPQRSTFDHTFPATALEVAAMGAKPENEANAIKALGEVGMEHLAEERIGELSGGQIQRVFLAHALVNDPDLLLLDEPLTGIDVEQQEKFCSLLRDLNKKGKTIVMVSHDLTYVANLVSKVACINKTLFFSEKQKAGKKAIFACEGFGPNGNPEHHHQNP